MKCDLPSEYVTVKVAQVDKPSEEDAHRMRQIMSRDMLN